MVTTIMSHGSEVTFPAPALAFTMETTVLAAS